MVILSNYFNIESLQTVDNSRVIVTWFALYCCARSCFSSFRTLIYIKVWLNPLIWVQTMLCIRYHRRCQILKKKNHNWDSYTMKNDNNKFKLSIINQLKKSMKINLLTVNPYTCNENVDKFNRTEDTFVWTLLWLSLML